MRLGLALLGMLTLLTSTAHAQSESLSSLFGDAEPAVESEESILLRLMRENTLAGDLWVGLALDESDGVVEWAREVGMPPQGLVLRDFELHGYLGEGQTLDLRFIQPLEREQFARLAFRDFGVGDLTSDWTTLAYHSFPLADVSQWKRSTQRFRMRQPETFGVEVERDHLAHGGLREFGNINGESERVSLCVPFNAAEGQLQGSLALIHREYTDHAERWGDRESWSGRGQLEWQLDEAQSLAAAYTTTRTAAEAERADHEVARAQLKYAHHGLGSDARFRGSAQFDLERTDSTYIRTWIPEDAWTLTGTLGFHESSWRLEGLARIGERTRIRPDGIGLGELATEPARTQFDEGAYLSQTVGVTQWQLKGQWRPAPGWLLKGGYRREAFADLPDYLPPFAEAEEARPTLWIADRERADLAVRVTLAPGQQLALAGLVQQRRLAARGSRQRFSRWDLTWFDATDPDFSWSARMGTYATSASAPAAAAYTNDAWFVGGGINVPLGEAWRLSGDATLSQAEGRDAFTEGAGSLALEYELSERLSLTGSYTLQGIDFEATRGADTTAHRAAFYAHLRI